MLAAVTIVIMILLSWTFGTCVEVPEWLENGYGITFHCPDGMPPVLKPIECWNITPWLGNQFPLQLTSFMRNDLKWAGHLQGASMTWPQPTWPSQTGPSATSSPSAA